MNNTNKAPLPAVRVKPLVWKHRPKDIQHYENWTVDCLVGEYCIFNVPEFYEWALLGRMNSETCASLEAAKAAAQADYEARILSSLESAPQPAVPEGWRPIETAPKDGKPIDVWTKGGERWSDVKWDKKKCYWVAWQLGDFDNMGFIRLDSDPTHWMPHPSPPIAKETKCI